MTAGNTVPNLDYSDVELPASPSDILTHPSHIGYYHQWSLLLLLSPVTGAYVCCFLCALDKSIADKVCRITILLEDSSKVVNCLRLSCILMIPLSLTWRHLTTVDGTQSRLTSPCVWASCRQKHSGCHLLFSWAACRRRKCSFFFLLLMVGLILLRWQRSFSVDLLLRMKKMSSTYQCQLLKEFHVEVGEIGAASAIWIVGWPACFSIFSICIQLVFLWVFLAAQQLRFITFL